MAPQNSLDILQTIEVPILKTNIPFIGSQNLTVPMKYFAVVKSKQLAKNQGGKNI